MRIGIIGSGGVGATLGTALVARGHEVRMGSRSSANEKATAWAQSNGPTASHGTFADAAAFGEVLLNCTAGDKSLDALHAAGADALRGKVLIDVANPLDFSKGMPPTLTIANDDSLGERIQKAFPDARVVKTLNTVNMDVMVNPGLVPGDHQIFASGDDAAAKARVTTLLGEWFGWRPEQIIDLGDIASARGTEMMVPLWIRLMMRLGTPHFNIRVVVGSTS